MAEAKKDVSNLIKHYENYKNRLNSNQIPERHKGREIAYKEFLQREVNRTKAKIESITGVPLK